MTNTIFGCGTNGYGISNTFGIPTAACPIPSTIPFQGTPWNTFSPVNAWNNPYATNYSGQTFGQPTWGVPTFGNTFGNTYGAQGLCPPGVCVTGNCSTSCNTFGQIPTPIFGGINGLNNVAPFNPINAWNTGTIPTNLWNTINPAYLPFQNTNLWNAWNTPSIGTPWNTLGTTPSTYGNTLGWNIPATIPTFNTFNTPFGINNTTPNFGTLPLGTFGTPWNTASPFALGYPTFNQTFNQPFNQPFNQAINGMPSIYGLQGLNALTAYANACTPFAQGNPFFGAIPTANGYVQGLQPNTYVWANSPNPVTPTNTSVTPGTSTNNGVMSNGVATNGVLNPALNPTLNPGAANVVQGTPFLFGGLPFTGIPGAAGFFNPTYGAFSYVPTPYGFAVPNNTFGYPANAFVNPFVSPYAFQATIPTGMIGHPNFPGAFATTNPANYPMNMDAACKGRPQGTLNREAA